MNYSRRATEKKLKAASSNRNKYTTRIFLTICKTSLIFCIFVFLVLTSVGLGMFMGIIDSSPKINVDSIVPIGYATTVYDSAGNLTDTLVTAGSNREEATYDELPEYMLEEFVVL